MTHGSTQQENSSLLRTMVSLIKQLRLEDEILRILLKRKDWQDFVPLDG